MKKTWAEIVFDHMKEINGEIHVVKLLKRINDDLIKYDKKK